VNDPESTDEGPQTLPQMFEQAVRRWADAEAIVAGDQRLTFTEWWAAAGGFASVLLDHGVTDGDVVAIALPSSAEFAVAYAAAVRLGAVVTGINPRLGANEVGYILGKAKPALVVCDGETAALMPSDAGPRVVYVDPIEQLVARAAPPPVEVTPDAAVAIVWTSGTTGRPKGAWFDHRALRAASRSARDFLRLRDRRLSAVPFVHAGFMTKVWEMLEYGTTTVVAPVPWTAAATLELLVRERISVAGCVPTQWEKLRELPDFATTDLPDLRLALTATAPASPALIRYLNDTLGCSVIVRYASTESGPATGTRVEDPVEVVADTVGRPLPGAEVMVADDTGNPAAPETVGRVRVRNPGRMRGYWDDPAETARSLTDDGWVVMTDLGYQRADGNLVLCGRASEMYIRGGYNVYPREVELAVATHPEVQEVAVVGTPAPVIGEIGVAVIVPRSLEQPPSLEDIRAHVRGQIADYKLPDEVRIVPQLPRNALSKVSIAALREIAAQGTQPRGR
jgi:acyl-CoA synthetase (AMP-forming)/AMP-acid ligase II